MTTTSHPEVALSPVDSARLGIKVARTENFTADELPAILDYCVRENVGLLVARVPANDFKTIHLLERQGFLLMDAQIRFSRSLLSPPLPPLSDWVSVRVAAEEEEDAIRQLAEKAFRGYRGHYQENLELAAPPAEEIYTDWAVNSLRQKDATHDVLIAERMGKIVGFATVCLKQSGEGDSPLAGTDPDAGRRSLIYQALLLSCFYWARDRGATRFGGNVLLNNIVTAKLAIHLGCYPESPCYTFHKLFRP